MLRFTPYLGGVLVRRHAASQNKKEGKCSPPQKATFIEAPLGIEQTTSLKSAASHERKRDAMPCQPTGGRRPNRKMGITRQGP